MMKWALPLWIGRWRNTASVGLLALALPTIHQAAIAAEIRSTEMVAMPQKLPLHLVDYWWDCDLKEKIFQSLSIDFSMEGDLKEGDSIYIAPIGLANLDGVSFYGGIQTNISGWVSKSDQRLKNFGRGAIFSRWAKGNEKISLAASRGAEDAIFEAAGYEGNFISVRRPWPWKIGTPYRYELSRLPPTEASGISSIWIEASVIDLVTQERFAVGELQLPVEGRQLSSSIASFVEIYGGSKRGIPTAAVKFSQPMINGKICDATRLTAIYPDSNPKTNFRYTASSTNGFSVNSNISPYPFIDSARQRSFPIPDSRRREIRNLLFKTK